MKAEEFTRVGFVTCVHTLALGTMKDEYRWTSLSRPDDVRMGVIYTINQVRAHLVKQLNAAAAFKCLCYTVFATVKRFGQIRLRV